MRKNKKAYYSLWLKIHGMEYRSGVSLPIDVDEREVWTELSGFVTKFINASKPDPRMSCGFEFKGIE